MMCKTWSLKTLIALTGLFFMSCGGEDGTTDPGPLILFTEEEAEQLRWPEAEWLNVERDRQAPEGPRIKIQQPVPKQTDSGPLLETVTPTSFQLEFEVHQAAVDIKSVRVRAGRPPFWKNLTKKLDPYIDGNSISADTLKIPEGRFRLEITISDVEGRKTQTTYLVHVQES